MRHEARFIKFAWKFGTQNLVATYTLTLMKRLEYFQKSILGKPYIVLKSKIQNFKQCTNWSWNKEVMHVWSKLVKEESWVRNGFRLLKTQMNARKLLVVPKFEAYYLFQARGMQFEPKNMEFLGGRWARSKFHVNFELIILILNWVFSFHLWVRNWLETLPNFEFGHWWSSLSPKTHRHKFQTPPSNSKHFVLI